MGFFEKDIKYLPGVGPKRAEILNNELKIYTIRDLLYHFPYRYIDRTEFHKINNLNADMKYIQVKGTFQSIQTAGNKPRQRLVAYLKDDTGILELIWFTNIKWIKEYIKPNTEYIIFGKPTYYNKRVNIVHPEMEEVEKSNIQTASRLSGMYNTTEKMKKAGFYSRAIQNIQKTIAELLQKEIVAETLSKDIIDKCRLMSLKNALISIHFPENSETLKKAEFRLKFDELFFIQLKMLQSKAITKNSFKGHNFSSIGNYFNTFYSNNLPFELTNAQKRVLREIRKDVGSGKQMNRLLQGDVGSGKTLVGLMAMLMALDNGYQACLMAPTEILATQHFESIVNFLNGMDVNVRILTGSTKKKQRDIIHEELVTGKLEIIIGTHALIEDVVQFKNLGMCIIDEQHRFGVAQRARLWKKNTIPPHVLVMTATPIPRTLAMTIYGDLDVSVIDELPPGRKPIKTVHYFDNKRLRLFGFMKEQITLGRQVYVVYPLIKESEKADYKDLEDGYESISRYFAPPQYNVSVVHGKMKSADKDKSMRLFAEGKAQIMVATTVIEVGVNVPNATVMVIESAERFGLSQLHQLRGRVGRGGDQSYCILMTSYKLSEEGKQRMQIMINSNDGFEISEADLKLRGPGDIEGTQQSGVAFDMKIANLGKDGAILRLARDIAQEIIAIDSNLEKESNYMLKNELNRKFGQKVNWGIIS